MIFQKGSLFSADNGSPLRRAVVSKKGRGLYLVGAVFLHAGLAAGLWMLSRPTMTTPPSPVVIELAAAPVSHHSEAPTEAVPVPPVVPPPPAKPAPSKPKPVPARRSAPISSSEQVARQPTPTHAQPPAGDMLGNALADVHQQGWQNTSQRYAQDSVSSVQTALARYRQDWVRATQTYVDLHFPRTHRDARMEFNVTVDRQGRLLGLDMVHSTGDAALDAQAFKAIRAAAPFRPFDAGMGNRQVLTFRQGWVFNQGALLEP